MDANQVGHTFVAEGVTGVQLLAPHGANFTVYLYHTFGNDNFCFTTAAYCGSKLQKSIELNKLGRNSNLSHVFLLLFASQTDGQYQIGEAVILFCCSDDTRCRARIDADFDFICRIPTLIFAICVTAAGKTACHQAQCKYACQYSFHYFHIFYSFQVLNYIKSLQQENKQLKEQNEKLNNVFDEIEDYMDDVDYKMGWQYANKLRELKGSDKE